MGVYTRYKKSPEGFRALVELLESTSVTRRQKLIEVGRAEDAAFTDRALSFVLTFEDLLTMPESELTQVLTSANPRMIGIAVSKSSAEIQERFLRCAPLRVKVDIRDYFDGNFTLSEIGGAQLNLVGSARECEKAGKIKTKRIPLAG